MVSELIARPRCRRRHHRLVAMMLPPRRLSTSTGGPQVGELAQRPQDASVEPRRCGDRIFTGGGPEGGVGACASANSAPAPGRAA